MDKATTLEITERRFRRLMPPLIVLAAVLSYANSFDGEFVWDDVSSVLLHEDVKDPSKFTELFRKDQHAFMGGQGNFYRPLVSASFMLDYALATAGEGSGDTPGTFPFHLTNTLWHAMVAVLLFFLMAGLGAPRFAQAAVPLVYVIHPIHSEAVTYISGRADPMAAAFMFAGLVAATRDETPGRWRAATVLIPLCFAGALLCKESSLIFPALLFGILLLRRGSETANIGAAARFTPLGISLAVLGVYVYLRTTVLDFGSDSVAPDSTFAERAGEALQSFALYIGLIVAPHDLHMERSLSGATGLTLAAGCVLLALFVVLLVYTAASRQSRATMGLSWFLITWLPISGLYPLNAPMAEHWMYVPMAGLLWALGEIMWRESRPAAIKTGVFVLTLCWCAGLLAVTASRNEDWQDNRTLFEATVRENPESIRAQIMMGLAYEESHNNLPGAKRHFQEAVNLFEKRKLESPLNEGKFWPGELDAHLSLGTIYMEEKRYGEALEHFSLVVQVVANADNQRFIAEAELRRGQIFLMAGNGAMAVTSFQRAIELDPGLEENVRAMTGADFPARNRMESEEPGI